jgi:hypothetical protein
MKKKIAVITAVFIIVLPAKTENVCKKIPEITLKCFKDREGGKIKNCKNGYKGDSPVLKKACEMGCLAESLYEANTTADILYSECKD